VKEEQEEGKMHSCVPDYGTSYTDMSNTNVSDKPDGSIFYPEDSISRFIMNSNQHQSEHKMQLRRSQKKLSNISKTSNTSTGDHVFSNIVVRFQFGRPQVRNLHNDISFPSRPMVMLK
jgi:hypothetical protein